MKRGLTTRLKQGNDEMNATIQWRVGRCLLRGADGDEKEEGG